MGGERKPTIQIVREALADRPSCDDAIKREVARLEKWFGPGSVSPSLQVRMKEHERSTRFADARRAALDRTWSWTPKTWAKALGLPDSEGIRKRIGRDLALRGQLGTMDRIGSTRPRYAYRPSLGRDAFASFLMENRDRLVRRAVLDAIGFPSSEDASWSPKVSLPGDETYAYLLGGDSLEELGKAGLASEAEWSELATHLQGASRILSRLKERATARIPESWASGRSGPHIPSILITGEPWWVSVWSEFDLPTDFLPYLKW